MSLAMYASSAARRAFDFVMAFQLRPSVPRAAASASFFAACSFFRSRILWRLPAPGFLFLPASRRCCAAASRSLRTRSRSAICASRALARSSACDGPEGFFSSFLLAFDALP